MSQNETKKEGFWKSTVSKATGKIKTTVDTMRENKQARQEQKQIDDRLEQLRKYNPLFPSDYTDDAFKLPNLIMIVDDAVRKGIDVCEGAIGWRAKEKEVEVLYLYDEAIAFSGLNFLPAAICDSVYYVDPHNRSQFIRIDSYFSSMQEEKLAELQHIAYSLGAKQYWVEMVENTSKKDQVTTRIATAIKKMGDADADNRKDSSSATHSQSVAHAVFTGNRKPVEPTLVWFQHDKNVQNLIRMRCSGTEESDISEYTIELNNANSASMSLTTATKINAAIVNMKVKCDISKKSHEEHSQKMLFKLLF